MMDVFSLQKTKRGEVTGIRPIIDTGDSQPVRQGPHRIPFALRPEITKMVEMLATGVNEELNSHWASPVVLLCQPDRFCMDYRNLNAATQKDMFPLSRIDDLRDHVKWKEGILYFRCSHWLLAD